MSSTAWLDFDPLALTPERVKRLSRDQLAQAMDRVLELQREHRKENQILYYEPVSASAARVHQSTARTLGVSGGNGSSKTESVLAEIVALSTGCFPACLQDDPVFRSKFRGPLQIRIVVESLINTLWPIILPKLQWFKWTGVSEPGGDKGHWGWIPKKCLFKGDWEKSFSKSERMLKFKCFDPDTRKYLGDSSISFMSKDNDPEDFASGDFDIIMEDEPPTEAIHRENQARTMRKNGRIILAMTWPDDPTIPVSWIYDEIYEPGLDGPNRNPNIEWLELDTRENKHLVQESVSAQMREWDDQMVSVRIKGKPIRFSSRIHPLFTERLSWWCFERCNQEIYVADPADPQCSSCHSFKVAPYCHVTDENVRGMCPVIFALDPHPRKPHMMVWVAVTPDNDLIQLAEAEVDGSPRDVREEVDRVEREYALRVRRRLIDPNMGATAPGVKRNVTWQMEFQQVGLPCVLADDARDVAITEINKMLRPDPDTFRPRIRVHERCKATSRQFRRYQWDNWKVGAEKGTKEQPKPVDDDFPTLWRYIVNDDPNFRLLHEGAPIIGRRRKERTSRSQQNRWYAG